MKRKNLCVKCFLILLVCLFSISILTSSVFAMTSNEITAKLDWIKANQYPSGSTFPYSFGGGAECYAFGRWLANEVFGSYPVNCTNEYKQPLYHNGYVDQNGWTLLVHPDQYTVVEPGDLIETRGGDHTALVWKVDNNTIYVGECWGKQDNEVAWKYFNGNAANATLGGIINTYGQNNLYIWKHPGGVVNTTPGKPTITGMKSYYDPDDTITFSWTATENTTHYNLYIYNLKDSGEYETYENIFYAESGITRQLPEGKYKAVVQATNSNAYTDDGSTWRYTDSEWVYFEIKYTQPGKPVLTGINSSYEYGNDIFFCWSETENTTHYNLYFDCMNTAGTYERFETIHYATNGLTKQFAEGKYRVLLQSTNSEVYTDDGSTWKYTDGDWVYFEVKHSDVTGICGDDLTWTLNLSSGVMTISGTGPMYNYTNAAEATWSEYQTSIRELVVTDGATTIGEHAFESCKELKTISLPGSLEKIKSCAFRNSGISGALVLPEGLKSVETWAFSGCSEITSVSIPASLTGIGSGLATPFFYCSGIEEFDVDTENPSFKDLDGVLFSKDGKTLYQYPTGREDTSYTVPNGTETIGWASLQYEEKSCKLKSITIPASVTMIGQDAFQNAVLEHVYYSGYDWQWDEIEIGNDNDPLLAAALHCKVCYHLNMAWKTAEAATCTGNGYLAFWYCDECACIYANAEATERTTLDAVTLSPLGHDYANGCCTRCGEADPTETGTITVEEAVDHGESVSVLIKNDTANDVETVVFCVGYDTNGKLIKVGTAEIVLQKSTGETVEVSLPYDREKLAKIKLFVVEHGASCIPLCEAVELE